MDKSAGSENPLPLFFFGCAVIFVQARNKKGPGGPFALENV
jgi:hypothetical protein